MRVVSPYRPFPRESVEHQIVGPFDWVGALGMMAESVACACGADTYAITDVDTTLPVPAFQFATTERRLMLWILDVSVRYLESPQFDCDTVMLSPDVLVFADLAPYFDGDLSVVVRTERRHRVSGRTMLNGAQWWPVAGKSRLIDFYREALALGHTLPEDVLVWGADTEPIQDLLAPIRVGRARRRGLTVRMLPASGFMESLSTKAIDQVLTGDIAWPAVPIVDFKYTRKHYMRSVFEATLGLQVLA